MSTGSFMGTGPDPAWLRDLANLSFDDAQARLLGAGLWTEATAQSIAELSLESAESDPAAAEQLLGLAQAMADSLATGPPVTAAIAYASARLAVMRGALTDAEADLVAARAAWAQIGDGRSAARSDLGLTQVLAMQGDYEGATAAASGAIDRLGGLVVESPDTRLLLARAYRNLGTVLVYQERHSAAREAYQAARGELEQFAMGASNGQRQELVAEFGHVALNLASAYTFLDEPDEAEVALREAVARFEEIDDRVNRGRAATNLGRLYLRVGDYAAALAQFDRALVDLVGLTPPGPEMGIDAWRMADELLLEHALAYVALNLLPEAELALSRCEALFRATGQPYELAQARFTQGMLAVRQRDWGAADVALGEALDLYQDLDNPYWAHRIRLARVQVALAQGNQTQADTELASLATTEAAGVAGDAVAWDVAGRFDLLYLQAQRALAGNEPELAERFTTAMAELIGASIQSPTAEGPFPHLRLRWLHLRGLTAQIAGETVEARRNLAAAVDLVDAQRANLPIEEVRTAFLDDKAALYADLVLNLLDTPLAGDDEVAAAFAVVERARSRALLEQIMASLEEVEGTGAADVAVREQRVALRRQLNWLYNQLLGAEGSRHLDATVSRTLAEHESALQRLEWQSSPMIVQAEPVGLQALQHNLPSDQQAVIYFIAGQEVMAFVVDQLTAKVVRHICTVADLEAALAALRFQMGRAELGAAYVARRAARLLQGVRAALQDVYELVAAPLCPHLSQPRLLVAPYGLLHQIPFHALWDGSAYWVTTHEIAYAPSASFVVHAAQEEAAHYGRFAGFAPTDARIPQAAPEVMAAAAYFAEAATYVGDDATVAQVRTSGRAADVLHLATHGLFRHDNSLFSALKLADGWLDVREIYRLPLKAALVVLSACESGVGDIRGGDEVIGLMRGFLAAGAHQVVASLWNVHDASAAAFMREFYAHLTAPHTQQPRAATALAAAQRWAIDRDLHPYFWAPFFAIG